MASQKGNLDCLKYLGTQNANFDFESRDSHTCAYIASASGNIECLQFLITQGVDLNLQDISGTLFFFFLILENLFFLLPEKNNGPPEINVYYLCFQAGTKKRSYKTFKP